jgi:hypothetical protein
VCLGAVGMFGIKTIGSFKYEQIIKTTLPTATEAKNCLVWSVKLMGANVRLQ